MAKPTLRDVATVAGVSVGTVSYALNGKGRVDPDTRERIRRIATELGYSADPVARGLRSGRTATLGMALGTVIGQRRDDILSFEWYGRVTTAAAQAAFEAEHGLLLLPAVHDAGQLRRMAFDGLIVVEPREDDPRLAAIAGTGIPTVALGRDPTGLIAHQVAPDTDAAVTAALDHLAAQGATRIVALAPDMPWEWTERSIIAYRHWCVTRGVQPDTVRVPAPAQLSASTMSESARTAALAVLRDDPPDAILALCLGFGAGVLAAARELGLGVPHDLLLAQDSDEPALHATDPPITAVDLFPEAQARTAVTMLLELLRGGRPTRELNTPIELRTRSSSRSGPG
ncbi:LacI family DNA-binding transcriptional regulator [Amycolatopsis mongoliensis]|uniref:LacI family DNA-binding transcriptional regulator n=1 Tax=Amycolatopsis mongoliensis TaxID=715475 RepID=A0A9Y2JPK4_9PSEU|nr:LacI family DNA-binding transcriptional regulator [Amycolatopsis sp. 4-36]WIY01164.1 LacI family DNA-binding transcriptional regulator [Amycolatopsis sp. 4-36]